MLAALVAVVVLVALGVAVLAVDADRATTVTASTVSRPATVEWSTTQVPASTTTTVADTTTTAPSTTRAATTAPPPATTARSGTAPGVSVRVTKVVDGDTIHISTGATVRIIGLDTPETKHPSKPVECFGPQASDQAHRLLDGAMVRVESEAAQGLVDKYGRSLYHVWLADGRLYSEVMIVHGFAHYYVYDAPPKYAARLSAAQGRAKQQGAGFWSPSTCNGNTDAPAGVPRSSAPGSSSGGSSGGGDATYPNCAAARAAGVAPIYRGSPGYSTHLHRDGDGVACE